MGKNKTYDKEYTQVQRLAQENKILKKQVQHLRKELSRLENRYSGLDDLVQQQYDEEYKPVPKKDLKKEWACHKCQVGYLKLLIINKVNESYYFRKCSECSNRTKLKRYTSDVKGIRE